VGLVNGPGEEPERMDRMCGRKAMLSSILMQAWCGS
jgi:hypothetical protein